MNPLRFLNECRNPKAFAWVHKFVINVLIVAIAHVDEKGAEEKEAGICLVGIGIQNDLRVPSIPPA